LFYFPQLAKELEELIALGILVDLSLEDDKGVKYTGNNPVEKAMSRLVVGFSFPFHVEFILRGVLVEHVRTVERQMQKHEDAVESCFYSPHLCHFSTNHIYDD
jgi:hypothetical protein